jgi:formate dehydrogenase major subunit
VQKLVRAAFGNNNVDTCARVCHSPTGYGLGQTYGTSAGTQTFKSVEQADVIMVIGANPTDAHPVFASRMKRRLREGAQADRDRPAPDRPGQQPACEADYHLQLKPGTNVAVINALAHVVVTEGLLAEATSPSAATTSPSAVARVRGAAREFARGAGRRHRRAGRPLRGAARLYAPAPIRPSTTAWASPSTRRARPW